jgi:hypothetical protein
MTHWIEEVTMNRRKLTINDARACEAPWLTRLGWRFVRFWNRKGTLLDRLEHLFFCEPHEYPSRSTWRVVGQPEHNRPAKCWFRVKWWFGKWRRRG